VETLNRESESCEQVREGVTRFDWKGKKLINVLSEGALVNISGGLGHPIEIMDLSFSVQGLSCHELVRGSYPPGVHVLPRELDQAIARSRLLYEGVELESLKKDQYDSIDDWLGEK
jgi:adenosylhomocysteinase